MASHPTASVTSLTLQPGDAIGNYTILERIGSGGGAGGGSAVYLAQDRLVARRVAIKQVLPPVQAGGSATQSGDLVERVQREAGVQKRIASRHPDRLVQVIEVLEDAKGRGVMLVTEYVDGRTLEGMLQYDRDPLDPKRALGVVASIARALEAIHGGDASGEGGGGGGGGGPVIHRDLKPANVFLPENGGLKVGDFGLAAAVAEQETLSLGSVRYMAPELQRGELADPRADLYSLGVIAYECFAGRERFEEAFKFVLRDERNRAMRWMKWHTNPRAKAPPLGELVPGLHPAVVALVAGLMEKDPAERPSSASAVVERVRRAAALMEAGDAAGVGEGHAVAGLSPADAGVAAGHTAPLPVARPSRLLPALLTVSLLLLSGTAGVLGYQLASRVDPEVEARRAAGELAQAEAITAWQDRRFDQAIADFGKLQADWDASTSIGQTARAGLLWATSDRAVQGEQYTAALTAYAALREMGEEKNRSLVMVEPATLGDLERRVRHVEGFNDDMRAILALASQDRTKEARQRLALWKEVSLTPAEEAALASVADRIEGRAELGSREDVLRRARDRAAVNDLTNAVEILNDHLNRPGSVEPDPEVVALRDQYQAQSTLAQTRLQAANAERAGDVEAQIAAYEALEQIGPEDIEAIRSKLASLRSEQALAAGEAALAAGEEEEARAKFLESLGFQENPRAKAALESIAGRARLAGVLDAAREADGANQWQAAIDGYREAISLGGDAGLQDRVNQLQALLLLQQADAAILAKNLALAQSLLVDARRVDPDNDEIAAAEARLELLQRYSRLLNAGEEALAGGDFGEAVRLFRQAREVDDTEEVQARLLDTEYASFVNQARNSIREGDWISAKASLSTARTLKDTQEVTQLMEQVEAEDQGETP